MFGCERHIVNTCDHKNFAVAVICYSLVRMAGIGGWATIIGFVAPFGLIKVLGPRSGIWGQDEGPGAKIWGRGQGCGRGSGARIKLPVRVRRPL